MDSLFISLYFYFLWEKLNIGTVPTFKMHTVPTFKMHHVGTVPTFKMHHVGTVPMFKKSKFQKILTGRQP